jgi:hydrogenase expression/formation protein HypE
MGAAARLADVPVATGDTKVVDAGCADGLFINTAGIGVIRDGVDIRPERAAPGDVIIVSGPIGQHGIAVMSKREGLEFATDLISDCAPLNGMVSVMLDAHQDIHVLRDPTRGGVTASLCEIASAAHVGITYDESAVPIPDDVSAVCSFLGLDAMSVANEGRLVAFVRPEHVDDVMNAMRSHEHGAHATVIGRVTDQHHGVVLARTPYGATRVVDLPLGEQLPRIC